MNLLKNILEKYYKQKELTIKLKRQSINMVLKTNQNI